MVQIQINKFVSASLELLIRDMHKLLILWWKLCFLSTIGVSASIGSAWSACNVIDGKAYGDCAGVRITEGSMAHLTVQAQIAESAIIDGATVLKGGMLDLSGTSNGDIVIHQGGRLRVTGVVNGTIINQGGDVEIEGTAYRLQTIGGRVTIGGIVGSVVGGGAITYKKGAIIGGVAVEKTVHTRAKQ